MALRSTVPASFYLLVIPSVLQAVASPAIVIGTFGDSVTLPCYGLAYRKFPEDQLDVLWKTDGGKTVAHFCRGVHSVGSHFTKRVTFLTENIKRGKFSINISSIAFSDEGAYECVWRSQEEDEEVLNDVKLDVMETMKCFGCGREGHIIRACPDKAEASGSSSAQNLMFHSKRQELTDIPQPLLSRQRIPVLLHNHLRVGRRPERDLQLQ
ncbi:hypothetical protein SKAU_G00429990 [Synaphobranchus kaupii]|uniref:Ig-like domain-containing protein n=1 Tax=Synaphobranchus kaupii TaxID=118154 RepID=A0A9Q1E4A8_SYNKA|nr:hypothetical protein SKAU_G00429990 [Synaphobranchus kaupii]